MCFFCCSYLLFVRSFSSCLYLYKLLSSSTENTHIYIYLISLILCHSLFPWSFLFPFGLIGTLFVPWLANEHAQPASWYISVSQSKNTQSYCVLSSSLTLSVYFCLYLSSLLPWHWSCLPAFLSQSVSVSLFIRLSLCKPYVMEGSCEIRGEGSRYAPVDGRPHFPLISAGLRFFVCFCPSFSTFPPLPFHLISSSSRLFLWLLPGVKPLAPWIWTPSFKGNYEISSMGLK